MYGNCWKKNIAVRTAQVELRSSLGQGTLFSSYFEFARISMTLRIQWGEI